MRKLKNENIILLDFHIKNRISEVKEKMILVCKDFKFDNNSLSKQNLISVNFDDDTSLPCGKRLMYSTSFLYYEE